MTQLPSDSTPLLELRNVSKAFGSTHVLDNLSIKVSRGETIGIIGPSGCGKTTLLRIAAHLILADSGQRTGTCLRAGPSQISYMPQESMLLPWRNLFQNALLPAELWSIDNAGAAKEVLSLFEVLEIADGATRLPAEASGGMQRRTAYVRALVGAPQLLLLDEPFTGLDYDVKIQAQSVLVEHRRKTNGSVILVTHDLEDAIALCSRLIVLSKRPAVVKREFTIDHGADADPMAVRTTPMFSKLIQQVWDELQYLSTRK